ncbi:MAG: hypothetical protein ABI551_06060 [Polyangiaceae bacterium]
MRNRPSPLHHLIPFIVLGAVAVAVPALAQQPAPPLTTYPACTSAPSKDDSEVAHGAYIAGKRAFDENDYPTALQYFKDALRRDCTKYELLNIISRADELAGDRPEAINALETYVKRAPSTDPSLEAIQKRLTNLKAQAAADASSKPAVAVTASASASAAPTTSASVVTDPPPAAPARHHSIAPWAVVGVGGAALVTGIVLFAIGENDISSASSLCQRAANGGCLNGTDQLASDKQNQGNTLALAGGIVGGVGVVAVVGGLIWHFTEPTGPAPSASGARIDVRPDTRPGYAGLSVGGAF